MFALFVRLHAAAIAAVAFLTATLAPYRPTRALAHRRGAELIEVALWAAVILVLAGVFRGPLQRGIQTMAGDVQRALENGRP